MNQQNANFFPWDDITEDSVFPTGTYHMVIEELEDGVAQSSGNRMFRARFGCKAPQEFVGMSHFENYVVGIEANPHGINAGTMGSRQFKKMLARAQVPPSNDIAALLMSAKGAEQECHEPSGPTGLRLRAGDGSRGSVPAARRASG